MILDMLHYKMHFVNSFRMTVIQINNLYLGFRAKEPILVKMWRLSKSLIQRNHLLNNSSPRPTIVPGSQAKGV